MVSIYVDIPMDGITMRYTRTWDPIADRWKGRIGRVCECGQMIPYFVQIQPLSTDWEEYD